MSAALALALAALAAWGWGGMRIDIQILDLDWGVAALTTPHGPTDCTIQLDAYEWEHSNEDKRRRRIFHEVGHCVGYYATHPEDTTLVYRDHSTDTGSVMSPTYAEGQEITPADLAHITRIRLSSPLWNLTPRIVIGGIAR